MSRTISQLLQEIGSEAVSEADGLGGRLLLYAEVEEGAMSADIVYLTASRRLRLKFASHHLQDLIRELWRESAKQPPHHSWCAMEYVVDGGQFNLDFKYPDQVNIRQDLRPRRKRVVRAHFNGRDDMDYPAQD